MIITSSLRCLGALGAATVLAAVASAQTLPSPIHFTEPSDTVSYVSFSGGFTSVDGNEASYRRLRQNGESGFGGVDAFRIQHDLGNDTMFTADGKIMVGDNEYLVRLRWDDTNTGSYLTVGAKESRVFYNISGGFFPWNGQSLSIFDPAGAIDRGEIWIEGQIVRDRFTGHGRASHSWRQGDKDSSMWADTARTGITGGNRNIVPNLLLMDEERSIIDLDAEYRGDDITYSGGVRWEYSAVNNQRHMLRRPGETTNAPGNQQRWVSTKEGTDTDLFSAHAVAQWRREDNMIFTGSASMTTLDSNLEGTRIFGLNMDSPYDVTFPRGSTDHGYIGLHGDAQWDQYVLAGNMLYQPSKGWNIVGGLRFENQTQDTLVHFAETAGPVTAPLLEDFHGEGERDFNELLGSLEATYTGVANWVFTGFLEASDGSGELIEEGGTSEVDRDTEFSRWNYKFGAYARWYPATNMNFSAGLYRKIRDNDYDNTEGTIPGGDVSPTQYPAFIEKQKLTTDDLYLRGSWRPIDGVSFVGRYDYQQTDVRTREYAVPNRESADMTSHIFSATLSWTPAQSLLVQAGTNYAYDQITTPVIEGTAVAARGQGKFDNNYNTINLLVMCSLDDKTDVEFDYQRFRAGNFRDYSFYTMPYGLSATDESLGLTFTRRVSENFQWSFRYLLGKYEDLTSGGLNDFDANTIYGRAQLRF